MSRVIKTGGSQYHIMKHIMRFKTLQTGSWSTLTALMKRCNLFILPVHTMMQQWIPVKDTEITYEWYLHLSSFHKNTC